MGAIQALYGYEEGAGRVSEREGVCVYCCNVEFFVIIAKSKAGRAVSDVRRGK